MSVVTEKWRLLVGSYSTSVNGRGDGVKILGQGELEKKLTVKVAAFSASARAAIEGKGGSCEVAAKAEAKASE